MRDRDQRIHDEVSALWRELYGQPPPIRANGSTLLDVIMRSLPERGYDRLASPHLRPSQIKGPSRKTRLAS
jgi:hypothetical protein